MKKLLLFLLSILIFFIIGEVDFRLLSHEHRLDYDVDDELYTVVRPNQTGYEWLGQLSFKSPPIIINSMGFRNHEIDLSRKDNYRILIAGSSIAFGEGVENPDLWSAILEKKLDDSIKAYKCEILNGSNPGWGPFQLSRFLKRFVPITKPDLIIIICSPYDMRYFPFQNIEIEKKFLRDSRIKKKIISVLPFGTYCYRKIEVYMNNFKQILFNSKKERIVEDNPKLIETLVYKQNKYFKEISEIVRSSGTAAVIVVLSLDKPNEAEYIYNSLLTLAKNNPFLHCRFLGPDVFNASGYRQLIIPNDGHLNERGHKILAEGLFEELKTILPSDHKQQ